MIDSTLNDFTVGQRVQMHPATDLWMRGARYGTVTSIGRTKVTVKLQYVVKAVRVAPENLLDDTWLT